VASYDRFCRPTDIRQPTWSVTSGAANAAYPVANLGDTRPDKPFKATGTSVTVRGTFGASTTLVGIVIVNHNLAGATATLTSGSGLNQSLTIPDNRGGQSFAVIKDFSSADSGQRTSTTFDVAITGGLLGNIAMGEILLISTWRDLLWMYGLSVHPKRHVVRQRTFGASLLQYNKRIVQYELRGICRRQDQEAELRALELETQGEVFPWLIVREPGGNNQDAYYVQFVPGTFEWLRRVVGSTEIPIVAETVSSGPPLFA
jgi:hypothetical protein